VPRGKNKEKQVHEMKTNAGWLHMKEFLNAVRTRQQPGCSLGGEEGKPEKLGGFAHPLVRRH
jgi:hypothetical protein